MAASKNLTPAQRAERARRAGKASQSIDAHIAAIVRRAPQLTASQQMRLAQLLAPAEAATATAAPGAELAGLLSDEQTAELITALRSAPAGGLITVLRDLGRRVAEAVAAEAAELAELAELAERGATAAIISEAEGGGSAA